MRKGFPAFEWWADPPQQVVIRLYLFNITNHEQFLNGSHTKLHFQEVGPYIFREKITHSKFAWHDNGTLTYTSQRNAVFDPELNNLSLNDTVIVPNVALLGIATTLSEAPFFLKFALNMLMSRMDSQPVKKMPVYDYLWNNSDPILELAAKVVPSMVPMKNVGVLDMIYRKFNEEVTVFIGPNNSKLFFTMDQYDGKNRFGYWPNMTCDSVKLATEGVLYHQQISKDDNLHFFRKTLCRAVTLVYEKETVEQGIPVYRYVLPLDTYNRPKDGSPDCYTLTGSKPHPDGLSEISQCFNGVPMAVSFPHFLAADPAVRNAVVGMMPDEAKHSAFVLVDPTTGLPLVSKAGVQCNLIMKDISGYTRVASFSNKYIPIFWLQLHQDGMPPYLLSTMYFIAVVLPKLQAFLSTFMVVLGTSLLAVGIYRFQKRASKVVYDYIPVDTLSSSASHQRSAL
jgi:scavenger receptor class B protein 1